MSVQVRTASAAATLLATAALALGQATTQPAAVNTDTPKGAVKTMATAMGAGDAKTLHNVLLTTNVTEEHLANAMTDLAVAMADLHKGMVDKYGAASTGTVLPDPAKTLQVMLASVDRSTETITGDSATITSNASASGALALKRVNGQWKVSVADLTKAGSADAVPQLLASLDKGIAAFRAELAEVNAGKYPSAAEAGAGLQAKMRASLPSGSGGPTTNPTR